MYTIDQNVEALSGTKTLVITDLMIQKLDPGGASRNVVLPAEALSTDYVFIIYNTADVVGEIITVLDDAAATIGTLDSGEGNAFSCDGTTWIGAASLLTRLQALENKNVRVLWFAQIDAGASGTITPPTGATIVLDQWPGLADCALSTVTTGQIPDGISPKTAGGVIITGTLAANGNWTISDTPAAYPIAMYYIYDTAFIDFDRTKQLTYIIAGDFVEHSLATAISDMLFASGNGVFVKKTLTEGRTILSISNVENTAHSTDAHTMTLDGRDVSTDGSKLDGVEAGADVTDATNVAAAGAVMSGGDLGTPSGGTLSNTTGLPLAGLVPGTAESDFICATTTPFTWVRKTLAQVKTILGLGTAAYTAATAYVTHALATAVNDMLFASGSGAYIKKTLAEGRTLLGLDGATTTIPVGGGAGTPPVWTTATGTGAPVRAGSPTFTGTPAAPTAAQATNTTQVATTAFVKTELDVRVQQFYGVTWNESTDAYARTGSTAGQAVGATLADAFLPIQ
ncbi:MAG: hypothetical protein Q8O94_03305, partial [bacterium]|nr:hypothetical protein [bacterium]